MDAFWIIKCSFSLFGTKLARNQRKNCPIFLMIFRFWQKMQEKVSKSWIADQTRLKTYLKWIVQPHFTTCKMDQIVVYYNIKGLHMHQNFCLWNFWIPLTYSFSVEDVNGTLFFWVALLIYWIFGQYWTIQITVLQNDHSCILFSCGRVVAFFLAYSDLPNL